MSTSLQVRAVAGGLICSQKHRQGGSIPGRGTQQCLAPFRAFRGSRHLNQRWRRGAEEREDIKTEELKEALLEGKAKPEKLQGEGKTKAEDKTLAIVTGAVSIGIGVLYLAGVTFMNSRGNELLPPPPEAFQWIGSSLLQGL